MALDRATLYLIPGFFGFADLGGITYFHHVDEFVVEQLRRVGMEVEVHYVRTSPTASLRRRAQRLMDAILETAPEDGSPIHLIGHSTGGLDARLFASPGAVLGEGYDPRVHEELAARVRSVVTVATPHRGTPMAFFFNSIMGHQLLFLLSLATIYALRFGQFPLLALFSVLGIVTRLDDKIGLQNTVLDQFYEKLFADFDDAQTVDAINAFLQEIRNDQSLLGQLTPGAGDLFSSIASDRQGVEYGCVVTRACNPRLKGLVGIGLNPYKQASHAVYAFLHLLTSFSPAYPQMTDAQELAMQGAYGALPDPKDSDGVVPTWSQLWGEVIHACWADHLDVCGHFSQEDHHPPHIDWLCSGTGFSRDKFEALWLDVAEFLARSQESAKA